MQRRIVESALTLVGIYVSYSALRKVGEETSPQAKIQKQLQLPRFPTVLSDV